jgi:hypothetical protein
VIRSLPYTPSLAQIVEHALRLAMGDVHTAMPGRIERYDRAKQVADVKPLLKAWREQEDGTTIFEELPVIPNVPVYCFGGGGFRITMPIRQGDVCELVFAERSTDRWQKLGGIQDPTDRRRFHLADALAFVGLHDDTAPWSHAPEDAMSIGHDSGPQVLFSASAVELGADEQHRATEAAVLGTTYRSHEDQLLDAIDQALTQILTDLTAALTGFTSAVGLLATPTVGGALAGPGFTTFATELAAASLELVTIKNAIAAFKANAGSYLSTLVKVR